jgi:hypothetical protein
MGVFRMSFRSSLGIGLCLLVCGCGSKSAGRPEVHPVHGTLLIGGKPPAKAYVTLHETSNPALVGFTPHAQIEADGSFRLSTFSTGDGAPVGKYALTVVWPGPPPKGESDDVEGPDQLARQYADLKHPAVACVEIGPETSELAAIDLKAIDRKAVQAQANRDAATKVHRPLESE